MPRHPPLTAHPRPAGAPSLLGSARRRALCGFALALSIVLASLAYVRAYAPVQADASRVPGHATLGVHTLVGQEEDRADPVARTRVMRSETAGSSFVAFVAGYTDNDAAPVDNLGNAWSAFGAPMVYRGYAGRFNVRAYLARDARGGSDHRVQVAKPGKPGGELTLAVVEVRDGSRLVDAAEVYAPTGTQLASGTVTTDGPALLVAFWWGDGRELDNSAHPDNGFKLIEQFTQLPPNSAVQCAVAVRAVDRAGRYSVTWRTRPAQGAPLWLFAFAPPKAAVRSALTHQPVTTAAPLTQ